MPLLFVHGVSVRDNPDYAAGVALRHHMFTRYVLPELLPKYPQFEVGELYWGDLGVKFRWDLASLFGSPTPRAMGAAAGPTDTGSAAVNAVTVELLGPFAAHRRLQPDGTEANVDNLVRALAKSDPTALIQAVLAPERYPYDSGPAVASGPGSPLPPAEVDGVQAAQLFLAAEAADTPQLRAALAQAPTADAVLALIQDALQEQLARQAASTAEGGAPAAMGLREVQSGARVRLASLMEITRVAARKAADQVRAVGCTGLAVVDLGGPRSASWLRTYLGREALVFFGDAFEYFRRGQGTVTDPGTIAQKADQALRAAALRAEHLQEPLVLVAHSFGGMVCYDLLSSSLRDLPVALWVTAGSQVALFAEMHSFRENPAGIPSSEQPYLSGPGKVDVWLNFYDLADPFAFRAEPVFGTDRVTDIPMPGRNKLITAHSAYFTDSFFYRTIAARLQEYLA